VIRLKRQTSYENLVDLSIFSFHFYVTLTVLLSHTKPHPSIASTLHIYVSLALNVLPGWLLKWLSVNLTKLARIAEMVNFSKSQILWYKWYIHVICIRFSLFFMSPGNWMCWTSGECLLNVFYSPSRIFFNVQASFVIKYRKIFIIIFIKIIFQISSLWCIMVSTSYSESEDPNSNLGKTSRSIALQGLSNISVVCFW